MYKRSHSLYDSGFEKAVLALTKFCLFSVLVLNLANSSSGLQLQFLELCDEVHKGHSRSILCDLLSEILVWRRRKLHLMALASVQEAVEEMGHILEQPSALS